MLKPTITANCERVTTFLNKKALKNSQERQVNFIFIQCTRIIYFMNSAIVLLYYPV